MFNSHRATRAVVTLFSFALLGLLVTTRLHAASKVNVDGKIVIANLDKHTASIRVAKKKKDIAPKKASVLSPKAFPVTIEYWNGARTRAAWVEYKFEAAGVYKMQFLNGAWQLARHQAAPKASTPRPATAKSTATRQPTYRRSTGSTSRVVRSTGRVYRGRRVPVVRRVCASLLWVYRFVQDEADRELIRDIIIGREIDDAIAEELWDRLDDIAVNLPADYRNGLERALDDLRDLSDQDLEDLEGATDADWDQVRDEFGDRVTDNAWGELESDFGDIDVDTLPADELDAVQDIGIDSLDSNVDLGDLEGGDVDVGDLAGSLDELDFGDVGGGVADVDIADLDPGLGLGDAGVGFGDAGAGLGDAGFGGNGGFGADLAAEPLGGAGFGGGGMDYDGGGFGDFGGMGGGNAGAADFGGGNLGGGDFGGGNIGGGDFGGGYFGGADFGGGDFGGNFGGDFGGGDFGGGFDDFGGGGFDDFGGGDFDF